MQRQTVSCVPAPLIVLESVPGDLRVAGWERDEIAARTQGEQLSLLGEDTRFHIQCDDDLILNIPAQADLHIESVAGDADLRGLSGACRIQQASGDVAGRSLASLQIQNLAGNLSLRNATGNISAQNIGGDAYLRASQADISLTSLGGDLHVRGASGNISAALGGDAVLHIEPRPGVNVNITAGGNILLRLPPTADVRLEMRGGGSESVHMNLPGVIFDPKTWDGQITLGSGSAAIFLLAGGEVTVTEQDEEWDAAVSADFDFADMPADLSGHIQRQVERAQRQAQDVARRVEQKTREAERRIQARVNARVGRWGMDWSGSIPRPPRPPTPPGEPVSDEERLIILRMLAEKKITAEEAEKLLSALEGGQPN